MFESLSQQLKVITNMFFFLNYHQLTSGRINHNENQKTFRSNNKTIHLKT